LSAGGRQLAGSAHNVVPSWIGEGNKEGVGTREGLEKGRKGKDAAPSFPHFLLGFTPFPFEIMDKTGSETETQTGRQIYRATDFVELMYRPVNSLN